MMGHRPFLDWAGTRRNSVGTTYAFSSVAVAARVAGSWTTSSVAAQTLHELGLADAYYVETVLSAVGPRGEHQDWHAAFGSVNGLDGLARTTGAVVDTDGAAWTLYLFHRNGIIMSQLGAANITVGCTFKLETDFTAQTATAYIDGVSQASLNFAAQSWYTADGRNA